MTEHRYAEISHDLLPADDRYLDELWSPISSLPDYLVSSYGRVWSDVSKVFIKPYKMNNSGHVGVGLRRHKVRISLYVHRLVAEAFIPNPESYPIVRHEDDDPRHNHTNNLSWGTQGDNMRDAMTNKRLGFRVRVTDVRSKESVVFNTQRQAAACLGISTASVSLAIDRPYPTMGYEFERENR